MERRNQPAGHTGRQQSTLSKRGALFFVKAEKKGKEIGGIPPAEVGNFLHILYGGSKQALFGNPKTAVQSAMRLRTPSLRALPTNPPPMWQASTMWAPL